MIGTFARLKAQAEQHNAPSLGFSHLCSLVCTEAPMLLMGRRLMQHQAAVDSV